MRAVTTHTAASVLGLSPRVLDNLLRRVEHEAIPPGRQGRERRIPVGVLAELLLATELSARMDISARSALKLARDAVSGGADLGAFLRLEVDLETVRRELDARLELAIESVARPPRGRPRRKSRPLG
jgi:hypothetical protein